ncbi:MAG: hypothetical protein QNJ68_09780 [Microcoleaceae cyanobacterium MO_207.B10]|nr:hypothetical protein [Microcoleaceae cyanobacterium MO_207.B10]
MDLQDLNSLNSRSASQEKQTEQTNTNSSQQTTQKHQKSKPKPKTSAISKLQQTTNSRAGIVAKAKRASQVKTATAAYESGLGESQVYNSARNQGFVDGLIMGELQRAEGIYDELKAIDDAAVDFDVSEIIGAFDPFSELLGKTPTIDVEKYQQKFSLLPCSEES